MVKTYTLQEVAEILQVTTDSVKNYIREGSLKKIPGMGAIRISSKELTRFIEGE